MLSEAVKLAKQTQSCMLYPLPLPNHARITPTSNSTRNDTLCAHKRAITLKVCPLPQHGEAASPPFTPPAAERARA